MEERKKFIMLWFALGIIYFVAVASEYAVSWGICGKSTICEHIVSHVFGMPFARFFWMPVVLTSIVLFFGKRIRRFWSWYILITVPIATILFLSAPTYCGGFLCDKVSSADLISIPFALIGIIALLIVGVWFRLKREQNK